MLAEYNYCVQLWSKVVQRLGDQAGVGHGQYLRLLEEVDEARINTQKAKAAYTKHVDEHGC
jgi:hypothetical protein